MPLDSLPIGTEARIVEVGGARPFRRRLMEMGFLPGTLVRLVRKNAVGGVIEVEVRRSGRDVTIFDSVGFALEDYSALRFLHELLAEEADAARKIDLVPDLIDPKDLYGGTLGRSGARPRLRAV